MSKNFKEKLNIWLFIFSISISSIVQGGGWNIKNSVEEKDKLPIVYHDRYDISFFGIEYFHPFDSKKYGKVAKSLQKELNVTKEHFYKPKKEVSQDDLLKVHDAYYLESLNNSLTLEFITEVPLLRIIPNFLLQSRLLTPMRYATQGTIDTAFLALKKGVGINLSGGYHHAEPSRGGGFCAYADIPLAIKKLREQNPELKVMYIDLDAHQGNGVETCLKDDKNTYIIDCYNECNYPYDIWAVARINKKITRKNILCELHASKVWQRDGHGYTCQGCNDQYLHALQEAIKAALTEFSPDIIFYNAGTDCYENDQIGTMALSKQGIIDRDEIVFDIAKNKNVPICMTLSGGYSRESAQIISASLVNLHKKGLLQHFPEEK